MTSEIQQAFVSQVAGDQSPRPLRWASGSICIQLVADRYTGVFVDIPLVFFNPETVAQITDDQGQLIWRSIQPQHYRSTTFMQYKSILKHAGAIAPQPLGGSSTRHYDPQRDLWELL